MRAPFVSDPDFTLYVGEALETLRELPAGSVDCIVTSPPYWGLRDYGTGSWEGGDPDCDHGESARSSSVPRSSSDPGIRSSTLEGGKKTTTAQREGQVAPRRTFTAPAGSEKQASNAGSVSVEAVGDCPCGARRVDQQLGLEPSPELYVQHVVDVFRELRRVLADHGTAWLNLGDSYATNGAVSQPQTDADVRFSQVGNAIAKRQRRVGAVGGLKAKDLVGIPWRVAFALQEDGWFLRADVIWAKPNPMPESVSDRPTNAHEYVFMLAKRSRYWFDQEAVREPYEAREQQRLTPTSEQPLGAARRAAGVEQGNPQGGVRTQTGRNIRSVWEIPLQPYADAHFAVYPLELVRRCLLAGCPPSVCRVCGKPRERIVEREEREPTAPQQELAPAEEEPEAVYRGKGIGPYGRSLSSIFGETLASRRVDRGWTDCAHADYRPGIVLDPFIGSGTTALAARGLGRWCLGIELNQEFAEQAARRLGQQSLLAYVEASG